MENGKLYHVFNRGNNKETLFKETRNYYYFFRLYKKYLENHLDLIAHCLMPDHFHLMVRVKELEECKGKEISISERFRRLFISYAQGVNSHEKRTGSLFQKNFKRVEITDDDYYTSLIAYIHYNPIKANLCKEFGGWKFSSYQNILDGNTTMNSSEEVISWFGGRQAFIEFHNTYKTFKDFDLSKSKMRWE